jgi:hypothetical protein
LNPTSSTPEVGDDKAEIITGTGNKTSGYTITAATSTTDGSLTNAGTGTGGPIAPYAGASLSGNVWGVKYTNVTGPSTFTLNSGVSSGNFVALTNTATTIAANTSTGVGGFTATYKAQANASVAAGTYSTTVTYTISD